MKCYKCGDSIESGKSFIPIDAPGRRTEDGAVRNALI